MKATSQILLYTARAKKNGKYPVKLRVVYQREHRDYKLGIDLTKDEFSAVMNNKPPRGLMTTANDLTSWKAKANQAIDDISNFTFNKFQVAVFGNQNDTSNIFSFFEEYIQNLKAEERIKTAISYQTSLNTFKRFYNKSKLNVFDINPTLLSKFQKWMVEEGNSITTVGIYVRNLRAVYNYCISRGVLKKDENYPFGKNRYIIPAGRNIKKALSLSEIKKIHDYKTIPGTLEDRARDFWMLSYFCNGINFKDLLTLKRKDIDGDMLRFIRKKTNRTSQGNQIIISCYLINEAKNIIKKWSGEDKSSNAFIFPILSEEDSLERQEAKVAQFIQNTNKNMKRICKKIELGKEPTTYYSRHSAATVLKRSGATILQIQEALGHSNTSVTQKYLDSYGYTCCSLKSFSERLRNYGFDIHRRSAGRIVYLKKQ